jgi:ABC-2 type transport system ATP-binding protein
MGTPPAYPAHPAYPTFALRAPAAKPARPACPVISAQHLTRRFAARAVVADVSFDVSKSEIVALLGPNGAGKTTTMRMLGGLIAPTSGTVVIDGVPLTRATAGALRARIGFLTESPGLWDRLTVRENLRTYAALYGLSQPDRAIERVTDVLQLSPQASVRAAELSKGMRQKVALARALLHEPPVMLLDEPTSGLDPEITRGVRRLLEERRAAGCAILVSTHNLDEAERLADRVAVLHERLLAIDRPAALRRRLATGRLIVRVTGDPARSLETVRRFDPAATIEGPVLVLKVVDAEERTPAIVAALVAAGAGVVEVRPEMPALEDAYLQLMSRQGG